ncbi:MAG: nucleoside triphosphate pyrophosphohydrolase [Acidimicrobiales bacterium]
MATVVVVGLGPAGEDLVTASALDAIGRIATRFVRTRRHPAAPVVGPDATAFDDVYEAAATLDEVYGRIADAVAEAALAEDEVLYAVPGSPVVAERTVELLRDDPRVDVALVPALSFLDLAWVRLGIDPVAEGVRVVDGQRFGVEAAGERGPLLVAQCDSVEVLSEVKLALGDAVDVAGLDPASVPAVTVLQRLGLPDEEVRVVAVDDLDRDVEPDHLTTLYLPALAAPAAGEVARLAELVAVLRRECPWDREQTHESLRRHLLEEAYEVLDAIDHLDPEAGDGFEHLEEELGDLLFQVVFHATIAEQEGRFTLADVARGIHDKLRDRHPHVFGDVQADTADEVAARWEQIKKAEKGRDSVFEGIPDALPALLFALKVQKKAASLGDLGDELPSPAKWDPAVVRARREPDAESIGDLLFAVVNLARRNGVDPEMALRNAALGYRNRVQELER